MDGEPVLGLVRKASESESCQGRVDQPATVSGPDAVSTLLPSGSQTLVSWESAGVLQSAPEVTGPWTDVQGAWDPCLVTPTQASAFYRLRAP